MMMMMMMIYIYIYIKQALQEGFLKEMLTTQLTLTQLYK